MTATPIQGAADRDRGNLAGTAALVRFLVRRDRVKLSAWVGGLGLMMVYVCTVIPAAYPTEDDLDSVVARWEDPAGRMLVGPGHGSGDPSYAAVTANGLGLWPLILAALMSIFLVVRHTRAEEQSGRAELVQAAAVGRRVPLTATLIVAVIANGLVALLTALVVMGLGGHGAGGSLLLGASFGAVGLAFAGIATVAVQLSSSSRAASGLAGAALGAAFVVRAAGDMARQGGSALSWFSPLAWGQQTAPFVKDRWWPVLCLVVVAGVTAALAFALSARRDLGAGLLATRPGRARAPRWLGTPIGLAFRLQRANIVGWTAALTFFGLINGVFADSVGDDTDVPEVFGDLFGEEDLVAGYLAFSATLMAYLMAVFAVTAVQGMRTDETGGRGEPVLAAPVSRSAWLGANLLVTVAALIAMAAIVGAASGVGAAAVTGDGGYVLDLVAAQLNQLPAVAVVLAAAVACFGAVPGATAATWGIVGFGLFAGTFGQVLDLPRPVLDLSPFEHPAQIPLDGFAIVPAVLLGVIVAVGVAVGFVSFRHRDVRSG
jgi:ABC-2 type transport system permease protein